MSVSESAQSVPAQSVPKPARSGNTIVRNPLLATKLRTLWDTSASLHTIADTLKVGTSTIVRAARELSLTPRPSPIHPGSRCAKKPDREVPRPVGPTVTQFWAAALPPAPPSRVVIDRPPRTCQWPVTDGRPWKLCGEPCHSIYCAAHHKRATGKSPS